MTRTNWHALHIGPQAERWLRKYGLDPMIPVERRMTYVTRYHAGLRRNEERPMFPGLAFVDMTPMQNNRGEVRWLNVRSIPGVRGVFSPYSEPYRFLAADMAILGELAKRPALMPYAKGDRVRVFHGPYRKGFEDVEMTVGDVDFRSGEVRLLADIMGRVAEIRARAGDVRRCA